VLLSDGCIGHLYETAELADVPLKTRNTKPLGGGNRHFTGLTHAGSHPRATVPTAHQDLIAAQAKKIAEVASRYAFYEYLPARGADTLIVAFGAASRAAYHFKDRCAIFRPIRIFPMLEELAEIARGYRNVVVVEMNTGQYRLLVEALLHRPVGFIPLLGGVVRISYIEERLKKCLSENI
jgi:2-oxoglutarate ferredoxin oxidoreductase subunit alpha